MALMYLKDPGPCPLADPKTDAGRELVKLHAAWTEQHARLQAAERDEAKARTEVRELDAAVQDAAYEDQMASRKTASKKTDELTEQREAAVRRAGEPWRERIEGAYRATLAKSHAFSRFVDDHLEELLDNEPELVGEADAVREDLLDVLFVQVPELIARWRDLRTRHARLVEHARGLDDRALPHLPQLDTLRRELDRLRLSGDHLIPTPRVTAQARARRAELKRDGQVEPVMVR